MRSDLDAVVAGLAAAAPEACDRAALTALVTDSLNVRGFLDALDARLAVALDRLDDGGDPAAGVLTGGGRRAGRDARAIVDRGDLCAAMPELGDALASGTMSAGQVDAVARAAGNLDDDGRDELAAAAPALISTATTSTVESFERHVKDLERRLYRDDGLSRHEQLRRQRSLRRWTDRRTGMTHTHLTLDPESDATLSAALDAAVAAERTKTDTESRTWEQLQADAMLALITSGQAGGRRPVELLVLVDDGTMRGGLHEQSVCETGDGQPVPPETVRRMACDADIIPIVLNGAGVVLDQGRQRRVATREQRRALRAMYRTCGHPGCDVRFEDCQIHHVIEWLHHRGDTNLANLLPLCSTHHHLVHEGGWHLTLRADRTITLRRPDGSVAFDGSSVNLAPTGLAAEPVEPAGPATELEIALADVATRYRRRPASAA